MTEAYTRMVSSIADNMNSAIRAANTIVFTNMDAFKTSIQQARDNARELSRIVVNAARTFEDSKLTGSTRVSFEREE